MYLDPPSLLVFRSGGVRKTDRAFNLHPGYINRWRKLGYIPAKNQKQILVTAKKKGIKFTEKELLYGKDIPIKDIRSKGMEYLIKDKQ